ncbi:MAG: hypothetical protein WCV83_01595 [Candidatus Magasanikbacteria bacterium]
MSISFLSVVIALLIFLLFVLVFSPIFLGVPFLPTHKKQALQMIEWANIQAGMKVIDLGSGAGRLLFLAAKKGANAEGYELNPFLVVWTRLVIFLRKEKNVKVYYKSIYDADISNADIVVMFLFPPHMKKMTEKLKEVKPGAKILSYAFSLPGWTPIKHEQGIFIYQR